MLLQIFRPARNRRDAKKTDMYRHVIHREAEIGGRLFGPLPAGVRREFFCVDEHNWVWHEEWTDSSGLKQTKTTRYHVTPEGLMKTQDGQPSHAAGSEEVKNFKTAVKLYVEQVHKELYNFV